MYIRLFGGGDTVLPAGWGAEVHISVLTSSKVDATAEGGEDAKLTAISVLGTTTVLVPTGAQVQLSGGDLMGSHKVDVAPADEGPLIKIQAIPALGTVKIKST